MRPHSKERLAVLFKPEEIEELQEFLDQEGGFSFPGEQALIDALLDLQEYRTFAEILDLLKKEWLVSWGKQQPEERGSPGAKGRVGAQNRMAIEWLYNSCHISSPFPGVAVPILAEPILVMTRFEVYRFGAADSEGWRRVARSGEPLSFQECKITFLEGEKPMELEHVEVFRGVLYTAPVVRIKRDP